MVDREASDALMGHHNILPHLSQDAPPVPSVKGPRPSHISGDEIQLCEEERKNGPEPRQNAELTENAIPLPQWATNPGDPATRRAPADPAKGFNGTVLTEDPYIGPSGHWTGGYYGYITIESAEVTGMKPARGDSQWVAVVSGQRETVYVPGCKVAAVHRGECAESNTFKEPKGGEGPGASIWVVP